MWDQGADEVLERKRPRPGDKGAATKAQLSWDGFSLAGQVDDLALLNALCGCYSFEALEKLPRALKSCPVPNTSENLGI